MTYADTARRFVRAEKHDGDAADTLPLSEWAEARRDLMTPQTIAANHVLYVNSAAYVARMAVESGHNTVGALRDLLAAIGETSA